MAVSRISSNRADLSDVTVTLAAFEKINQVRVQIELSCLESRGMTDLNMRATAWSLESIEQEARPLGYANVTFSATNLRSLDAALIHLLYLLDGRLAEQEFVAAQPK